MATMSGANASRFSGSLLLVSCLMLISLTRATDFKYCDKKGNYAVKVHDVKIVPNPVLTGKPATFNIAASTGESLSGGEVLLQVFYFGIPVHSETHDICDESSCPLSGDFLLSHTQTLPGFAPPGRYTLTMRMEDDNKRQLTCISFSFGISFGSLASDK